MFELVLVLIFAVISSASYIKLARAFINRMSDYYLSKCNFNNNFLNIVYDIEVLVNGKVLSDC